MSARTLQILVGCIICQSIEVARFNIGNDIELPVCDGNVPGRLNHIPAKMEILSIHWNE